MSKILIDKNNMCLCDCGTKCILGRVGSESRCTKRELEAEGFTCVVSKDMDYKKPLSFNEWVGTGGYFDNISVNDVEELVNLLKKIK